MTPVSIFVGFQKDLKQSHMRNQLVKSSWFWVIATPAEVTLDCGEGEGIPQKSPKHSGLGFFWFAQF